MGRRRSLRIGVTAIVSLLGTTLLQASCMLITSPTDFSISNAVTPTDAGDAMSPSCKSIAGTSMCGTCVAGSCCSTYTACINNAACSALLDCASNDTSCMNDNASGVTLENAYVACADKNCAICSQAGIGDPCGGGVSCANGLTCTGIWCTKSCAGDPDCAGIYMNGDNSSGTQNRCVINGENAAVCFPGCGSMTDCQMFSGTTCTPAQASVGGTTNVCGTTAAGDGGASDGGGGSDGGGSDGGGSDGGPPSMEASLPDAVSG